MSGSSRIDRTCCLYYSSLVFSDIVLNSVSSCENCSMSDATSRLQFYSCLQRYIDVEHPVRNKYCSGILERLKITSFVHDSNRNCAPKCQMCDSKIPPPRALLSLNECSFRDNNFLGASGQNNRPPNGFSLDTRKQSLERQ